MPLTIKHEIGICVIIPVYLHDDLDDRYVVIEVDLGLYLEERG